MNTYELYDLKISTLTPLHIGSGRELLNEYDYAVHKGQTWRLNDSAILDAQLVDDDPKTADRLARVPPAQLLNDADFDASKPFFRYVIKGMPRSEASGAQVKEQLKDTFDFPYLPGSSLKGSLRTAIAWYAWKELNLKPSASKLKPRREWAGQGYEQEIFGKDPNRDILRALQVGDSKPIGKDQLILLNARVVNRGGTMAAPVEMEAIRANAEFTCSLKVDLSLFSEWAEKYDLKLRGREWLLNLPKLANEHAQQRLKSDIAWFKELESAKSVAGFLGKISEANLSPSHFILQLGWGTGWEDKTLGSRLQADPSFMERIIADYRMTRGKRQAGDPFPKSRRAAISIIKGKETPASPMGWVLVEMVKRK